MKHLPIEPGHVESLKSISKNIPASVHRFDKKSIDAINAALAAKRPLLVRGEPGIGKTQLARAAAKALGWAYLHTTIDVNCTACDLLYRVDAVTRLGEAQVMAALSTGHGANKDEREREIRQKLDEKNFIHPGPVWWAFDWESASRQSVIVNGGTAIPPLQPDGGDCNKGCVLLVDEIDKAESDLPNGLLEAFGNGCFKPPAMVEEVCNDDRPLLVVITTNEERALPDAFLRRCLVLFLYLNDETLVEELIAFGKNHFRSRIDESVMKKAAGQLQKDRKICSDQNISKPGLAEYLDLLRAVAELGSTNVQQQAILDEISQFVLEKHPESHH